MFAENRHKYDGRECVVYGVVGYATHVGRIKHASSQFAQAAIAIQTELGKRHIYIGALAARKELNEMSGRPPKMNDGRINSRTP